MITWNEIMETCDGIEGDYRQRLVAYFKSIEGQKTDRVVRGKVVCVTARSFAEARGINHATFARWVSHRETPSPEASKQKTREIEAWHVNKAVRDNPRVVLDAIEKLPQAERKAIEASVREIVEPTLKAIDRIPNIVTLEDIVADEVAAMWERVNEGKLDVSEYHRQIEAARDVLILALMERGL